MYLPKLSMNTRRDIKPILKRSLLNQLLYQKVFSQPYYLPIAGFPKNISDMWDTNSLVQVLNTGHRIYYPTTITINPRGSYECSFC